MITITMTGPNTEREKSVAHSEPNCHGQFMKMFKINVKNVVNTLNNRLNINPNKLNQIKY